MNNLKKLMKNCKGISPIFATLILIAIAVIAGVVVYMFTSGTLATMTNGGTAAQEKVTVQAASIVKATGGTTTVYVQQTGGPAATVNSLLIKDTSGNTVGVISGTDAFGTGKTTVALAAGTLTTISGTTPSGITVGSSYTIIVTTAAGGSFVSPSCIATSS
jgi:flagellin-like protein